jgi:hypothetical protein
MIRSKVRALFVEERLQTKFARSLRLLIVAAILWWIAFPYIAQDVFTSENALDGRSL